MTETFQVGDEVIERIGVRNAATDYRTTIYAYDDVSKCVRTERTDSWYDVATGKLIQWGKTKGKWPEYAAIHHPPRKANA